MSAVTQSQPVRYHPSIETPDGDERETIADLVDTMRSISRKTFEDSGHAIRSVHAKSHGLLRGELRILAGLPPMLAQGLFARAGTYPVVLRFSTTPGDILDDNVSTPRGLAIKVVGVPGDRLPGSEQAVTQDFVMVNGPAFNATDLKAFLKSLKQLAATTDKAPGAKKALSTTLQYVEKVVETFGGKSVKLISMGGHPETNPLGETYFSQAAMLYGPYIAKVAVAPVSPELKALTDAKVDLDDRPNGLRDTVVDFFRNYRGEWELRVQFCTDLETMPVEDASVVWPEDQSPYIAVARISAPPPVAWSEARSKAIDEGLSFSPWHGLAAHRPLGAIMRARKPAYESSTQFRSEHNQRNIDEPRRLDSLPD